MSRQKVTPFLWFNYQAEEAANFYVSLFKNSKVTSIHRYPEGSPAPAGSVMTVEFELAGVQYIALNGGPYFQLTEAFSLSVDCQTQAEIDELWDKLIANGGSPSQCGWLKDRFGLSWQIVPSVMGKLMSGSEPEKSARAMQAMMQMVKLDIQKLQDAYHGVA